MKTIREDIKNNTFSNFYLLYGEDDYMKNLYKNKLKTALLNGSDEMNFSLFTDKVDINAVTNMATTLPFFHDKRVIFIQDSNLFKEANDLADFLPTMPDTTYFVFIESSVDKRNRLYKYVKANGHVVEMNGLTEYELIAFVKSQLQQGYKKITDQDAKYMLDKIGYDMNTICNECSKVISYAGNEEIITRNHIDSICIATLENKIFEMLDCIASGNKDRALVLYNNLIALKEAPIKILSLITRHYNILYKLYYANKSNVSSNDAASSIGIPPFAVKKYSYQLKKYNGEKLKNILNTCLEIDEKSKSGRIDPQIGVEMLIVSLF